ncbi:hypothetical protein HZH66_003490 [Vespula vulgaris]|uniref:Uncharacterized protein n=1 Tax=Vespula vulgaris TaxID=7454 RepID=A0A834NDZ0_VESVU|nr:hypothetical protein HZH66_003490 [Vespula vulgaris]
MDQLRGSPRSPDFNPLDFLLYGYLKSKVYSSLINNLKELQKHVGFSRGSRLSEKKITNGIWKWKEAI